MMNKQVKLSEKQVERIANERAVFDGPVQVQRGAIHKVTSIGTMVEFTDRFQDAQKAYKEASTPKQWFKVDGKIVTLVQSQLM